MKSRRSFRPGTRICGLMFIALGACTPVAQQVRVRPVPAPSTHQVQFTASRQGTAWTFDVNPDTVYVSPGDVVEWEVSRSIPGLLDWELDLDDPKRGSPARDRQVSPSAPGEQASTQIRLDARRGHYKYSITIRVPNPPAGGASQLLVTLDPIIRVGPD